MKITLHDSIENLDCNNPFVRNYLAVMLSQPVHEFIPNVQTELKALQIDDVLVPITITKYHPENS